MTVPLFAPGKEPLPPGWTEEDRAQLALQKKYQDFFAMGMESCAAKSVIAGVGGASYYLFLMHWGRGRQLNASMNVQGSALARSSLS